MKLENNFDEVLIRYLLNIGDKDEAVLVLNWINESQSNRIYIQDLANTLKLVDIKDTISKIDIDQEWAYHVQLKNRRLQDQNEAVKTDNELFVAEKTGRKAKMYKLWTLGAVAASLLFIVLLQFDVFNNNKNYDSQTVVKKTGTGDTASLMSVLLHEKNTTNSIKNFRLPDGSYINLFSNSELTYQEPADKSRREVLLSGKANFEVAKDKTRPFTVFSGDISTTALGTQFTVTAMPFDNLIFVRLHEGRVAVKQARHVVNTGMKDVYLIPGQELVYDVINKTAIVKAFFIAPLLGKKDSKINNDEVVNGSDPLVPKYGKESWFMFNNQPLNKIFDNLSGMFNVKIVYNKKDIDHIYFIGTFNKSDSLEFILHEISSINNLLVNKDISKTDEKITYRILKPKN